MKSLKMKILPSEYRIYQLAPNSSIPTQVFDEEFFSVTKTEDEVSLVCSARISIESKNVEAGFSCMQVVGPLDFSLTGILSEISSVFSRENISIFAISTFNTDYILFKTVEAENVKEAFSVSGHKIL